MSAAHKDDQVIDLGSEKYSDYHSAILLASVALTAFAGAAAAEVSFGGDAAIGYIDGNTVANNGMYWNADLNVSASQELDNGLTAAASFHFNITDNDNVGGDPVTVGDDFVLSLTSATAGLVFGDTEFAAVSAWKSAGSMLRDGFREIGADETVLKGNVSFGSVEASVSYLVTAGNDLQGADIGVTADLGAATVVVAYQEAIGTADEILGLSAATTLGGADLTVAYAKTGDEDSIGAKVGYAMGDVKVTAFYVAESLGDDGYGVTVDYSAGALSVQGFYENVWNATVLEEEYRLQGQYDLGNGLVVTAGLIDGDDVADDDFANYLVAEYDLGGGASVLASFVDGKAGGVGSTDVDTFGGYELNDGTTLELSFAF